MHGEGTYTWGNTGNKYSGSYAHNKKHGQGRAVVGAHGVLPGSEGKVFPGDVFVGTFDRGILIEGIAERAL